MTDEHRSRVARPVTKPAAQRRIYSAPRAVRAPHMSLLALIHRQRSLLWELLKREIGERYAGSALGWMWVLTHQLFLVALYALVFAYIFPSRIDVSAQMPRDYVTYILAGLVPWLAVSETLSRSPVIFIGSASLVKQVVFPIELLPVRTSLAAMTSQFVALLLLVGWMIVRGGSVPWTIVLIPVLLALQLVMLVGLSLLIASITVYLRDTKELVQLFVTAGLFMVPVLYLPEWLDRVWPGIRVLLYLNPFSYLVWCSQDLLFFGRIEHPFAWVVLTLLSVASFAFGTAVFRRLRIGFGDRL